MWCLGERAGAEQMKSVLFGRAELQLTNGPARSGTKMQIWPFLAGWGLYCPSAGGVFVCEGGALRSPPLFFIFRIGVINGGRAGLARWPLLRTRRVAARSAAGRRGPCPPPRGPPGLWVPADGGFAQMPPVVHESRSEQRSDALEEHGPSVPPGLPLDGDPIRTTLEDTYSPREGD